MKIKALHEEKGRLIGELNALQTAINAEQRSMTETEKTRFNEIDARLDSIGSEVETLEKLQNSSPCQALTLDQTLARLSTKDYRRWYTPMTRDNSLTSF